MVLAVVAILTQGCEIHVSPEDSREGDSSLIIPDKIAFEIIVKRLDAENINYWIDDKGRIRYSQELGAKIGPISDQVIAHRHEGVWVQYGGSDCDYDAALIAILEERGIEYLVEPPDAGDFIEGNMIHWYPTEENYEEVISAEVESTACSNR